MFQYRRYNIKDTDQFQPDDYPKVLNELTDINKDTAGLPGLHKEDILLSFLKDQSVNSDFLNANPAFGGLVTSRHFNTIHLESLFDSCRLNQTFTRELEKFIRESIS